MKKINKNRILYINVVIIIALILLVQTINVLALENRSLMRMIPRHRIIFVNDDNTMGPWEGTQEHPYQCIQDAINNARVDDTVFVFTGVYNEHVLINKTINLVGENKTTTVIDGDRSDDVIQITADYVLVKGFKIQQGQIGIHIFSDYTTIFGNIITENVNPDGWGIHITESSYNTITDNIIMNNEMDGISIGQHSNNNVVSENMIYDNTRFGIISWYYSVNNEYINNMVMNNENYGMYVYRFSNNNIFSGNLLMNNSCGLFISSSYENIMYNNQFIDNIQNAYDFGVNTWDDGYPSGGNYWDDYDGVDVNGDGIGDTPYEVPGRTPQNQDRYPLMESDDEVENLIITEIGKRLQDSILN